jgi:NAD(P)-dependent dehydrogenase (short-subunit alcohol dehydrogenase family)
MTIRFDGRVAAITGAGRGLGRAYALLLAARGARLVVNNRLSGDGSSDPAEALAGEIRARGGSAVAERSDVRAPEAASALVERALASYGRLDIVIHNAGAIEIRSVAELGDAEFQRVFETNTLSALRLTREALPAMRRQRYGRIVFTTSTAGLYGNAGLAAYAMAKGALLGLMRAVAAEEGAHGILSNAICPTAVTRMTEAFVPDEALRAALAPERVAPAVAWLASEQCTASGLVLLAGGGFFRSAHTLESAGVALEPGSERGPERVAEHAERMRRAEGLRGFESSHAHFDALLADVRRAETQPPVAGPRERGSEPE